MEKHSQKETEKIQHSYLEKLRNYKEMGVKITIDGEELPEQEWGRIFTVCEPRADGANAFYMADVIAETKGIINEIRLDKIYVKI